MNSLEHLQCFIRVKKVRKQTRSSLGNDLRRLITEKITCLTEYLPIVSGKKPADVQLPHVEVEQERVRRK